jgi:hypothetical protein
MPRQETPARAEIRYHRQRIDYRLGHGEANRMLALPVTVLPKRRFPK